MSDETRTEALDRIAGERPDEQRQMYRHFLDLFFHLVLGEDDGEPVTHDRKLLVVAAIHRERDLILAEAGYSSMEEMEAAQ